jgi:cell division protein FtsB
MRGKSYLAVLALTTKYLHRFRVAFIRRFIICFRYTVRRVLLGAMNVDLGIWGKLTRVVIFLFLIAGLMGLAVWYLPLIRTNERMRKETFRQDTQIQKEEEISKQLKASIDALRYDPKAVERLARERLGYAKPGETVIRFEPPVTNQLASH